MGTQKIFCVILLFSCSSFFAMEEMAVMMGAQIGGSIANQAISTEFEDMASSLTKEQTNISTAINTLKDQVMHAQSTELKNAFKFFQKASANIATLLNNQQSALLQMDTYIQAQISTQQPQIQYLQTPDLQDQYFSMATMYTPQGPIWKNIFPVGNWDYDETLDSFWQMSAVAMTADAANNLIFAEWFCRQPSYEIEAEITLYHASVPFFAGLVFNKARWISGNLPRWQQYRLFGLYGNDENAVQLVCTDSNIVPAAATTPTVIIDPLAQVVQGAGVLKIAVPANLVANLKTQSLTFRLKIINSVNKIQCKFWPTSQAEPAAFVTVKTNNPDLYLYHGIGFMAPGCVAQFKLLQPKTLLFATTAQQRFKAEVDTWLQNKVATSYAGTIDKLVNQGAAS
jgi:hypothetical protein